ncbi:response regulator [Ignatzschineria sp. RMDPL8A]|uniref:response regulator n=1 Tax=Ignatzschineria sp. RMDPL8A TaxID=2999236 RepID=UPI0024466AA9|nr:response regulator [Ignatzschineria sp. RMDPL8A]MDG9728932.1 response regulator [Ignatzschineria sp. RMDPL8A]
MFKNLNILIIDDSATARITIKKLVEELGHSPILANNGLLALEVALQEMPDLILLDLSMPVLDGPQVLSILKRHPKTAHIPIAILSGKEEASEMIRAKSLGAIDFVKKPCSPESLSHVINQL